MRAALRRDVSGSESMERRPAAEGTVTGAGDGIGMVDDVDMVSDLIANLPVRFSIVDEIAYD